MKNDKSAVVVIIEYTLFICLFVCLFVCSIEKVDKIQKKKNSIFQWEYLIVNDDNDSVCEMIFIFTCLNQVFLDYFISIHIIQDWQW